jgi:predicted dehydrogenase
MKRARYGVIGFGRFADKAIASAIRLSHNSELVAIQNRSLTKAKEAATAFDIPLAFDSVAELVAHPDVDAVFIVSANSAHCSETILTAEAGKHVICEKPMAMNVAECQRMIDACKKSNVKLMVGHMLRLSPLVRRMKELVQSGAMGKIIHADSSFIYDARLSTRTWLLERNIAGGGPTFDVGVHCFDTMRFILDDEVVSVKGELSPTPTSKRTDSSAQLMVRFAAGTIGTVFTSYDAPIRESFIEILGTEARISALDFTVGGRQAELMIEKRTGAASPQVVVEKFDVPNLYAEEVSHFSNCILTNSEPALSGENGLMNQRILDTVMNL